MQRLFDKERRGEEPNTIFWQDWTCTLKADSETWIVTDPDQSAHTEGDLKGGEWPHVAAAAWE